MIKPHNSLLQLPEIHPSNSGSYQLFFDCVPVSHLITFSYSISFSLLLFFIIKCRISTITGMDVPWLGQFLQHRLSKPGRRDSAQIDTQPDIRTTCLQIVTLYSRLKVIQVLVKSTAGISLGNSQGETALEVLRKNTHSTVVQVLADRITPEDIGRNIFDPYPDIPPYACESSKKGDDL